MTIISDALDRAGFDRKKFELRVVLKNFLECGGSRADVIAILDELRSGDHGSDVRGDHALSVPPPPPLPREGQRSDAGNGQTSDADARQPIASEGHSPAVQQDRSKTAPAGDPIPGIGPMMVVHPDLARNAIAGNPSPDVGHTRNVKNDQAPFADIRTPLTGGKAIAVVPPKANAVMPPAREPDEAYLHAIAETQRRTAKVQLDLLKTSTGQFWGDIRPREFPGMERDGHIASAIREAYGPFSVKQEHLPLRDFLPDEVFRKALTLAEVARVR